MGSSFKLVVSETGQVTYGPVTNNYVELNAEYEFFNTEQEAARAFLKEAHQEGRWARKSDIFQAQQFIGERK